MGKYKSQWTGPQIDEGVGAARNPDTTPTTGSDALITSDAVAKVQQGFAPIETDATASQAYAIGDLLVWGGILYKAKTAIAVNDSFTVGTNIEATTVADKLNNIDPQITSDTDTTLMGLLTGNGSKVGTKTLDTSGLIDDNNHVPTSGVVKSALTSLESDLASIHATGTTNTTGAAITAGTYFYLNGVLVQAIGSSIGTGAPFTLNTNYKVVTAGGLNDLMSALSFYKSGDKITTNGLFIGIVNYYSSEISVTVPLQKKIPDAMTSFSASNITVAWIRKSGVSKTGTVSSVAAAGDSSLQINLSVSGITQYDLYGVFLQGYAVCN